MSKEINDKVRAAVKDFCRDGCLTDRCNPDECEFCPAQQLLDMVDEMDGLTGVED